MSYTIESLIKKRTDSLKFSCKKPSHIKQLFFKDFFDLELGTFIIIHGDHLKESDPENKKREKVQFIKICQGEFGYGPRTWGIHFKRNTGKKQKLDLYFLGATKSSNDWINEIWVTIDEEKNHVSYDYWLESIIKYGK